MVFTMISSLLMRLISHKDIESHFYFEQQKASDDKVLININCNEKYKMLHHINFFDNLLRMLGFASAIFGKPILLQVIRKFQWDRKLFFLMYLIRRLEAYHTFLGNCIHFLNEGNSVRRDDYASGYTLFAFHLTPDLSANCAGHWNRKTRKLTIRSEIQKSSFRDNCI